MPFYNMVQATANKDLPQCTCPDGAAFDHNRNGRIDVADVVWLFNNL